MKRNNQQIPFLVLIRGIPVFWFIILQSIICPICVVPLLECANSINATIRKEKHKAAHETFNKSDFMVHIVFRDETKGKERYSSCKNRNILIYRPIS